MSTSAIVMMIISIVVVWGGMVAAILKLRGHPDPDVPESGPVAGEGH
ncbi:methionine/alanine import family NSS transporter small subunit [Streptomyces megasporus]|nr:methionine/alanine import family NSS transporter small subunit [Streptomyces megasporus]